MILGERRILRNVHRGLRSTKEELKFSLSKQQKLYYAFTKSTGSDRFLRTSQQNQLYIQRELRAEPGTREQEDCSMIKKT
jgi:hypothetical protein